LSCLGLFVIHSSDFTSWFNTFAAFVMVR
jgi:hypothetical protein